MVGYYNYTVWMTYLSLASGSCGIYFALSGNPSVAVICLLFSGFCDMFDGRIARTKTDRTENEKAYGIEIDSLTDLVCFGVLPVAIGYSIGMTSGWFVPIFVIFILCGMIRLAYYNVLELERQSVETESTNKFFWGLPITTSSIIFPIAYLFKETMHGGFVTFYAVVMSVTALLFVSKVMIPKIKSKYALLAILVIGIVVIAFILFGNK